MAVEERTGYFSSPYKTEAAFFAENPILAEGVTGTESDTYKSKCGDGITNWNALEYNPGTAVATAATNKFKPLVIGYAGDSIAAQWSLSDGLSGMFWFETLFYPCRTEKSFSSAVGGTKSANLLEIEGAFPPQIDELEALAVKPDLLLVHTTQNDFVGTTSNAEASALNVTTYCDRAIVAGVGNIIIVGHPPKTGSDEPIQLEYLNRILSSYADITEGVYFIDVLSLWREIPTGVDPSGNGVTWRAGYSTDGTHPSTKAMFECGKLLVPILEPLVQPKDLQPTSASEYNETTAPYANVFKTNGMMLGTNGEYNTVPNVNIAGATVSSHWEVLDGNGVIATPSIIIDSDGYNRQQIVLSGTATADQTVIVRHYFAFNVSEGEFIQEALLNLNSITGVDRIRYGLDSLDQFDVSDFGFDFVGDNKLHLTTLKTWSNVGFAGRTFSITIDVKNGVSPTGTLQLGRCGVYRQVE